MEEEIVSVLPIHYSDNLSPDIHIHQFPLLNRPLQVPPTAAASGKFIKARLKPNSRRLEIHLPVDTRPEIRNLERSKELGAARFEDDRDKNQESKDKMKEGEEPRLPEVRLRSEEIPQRAVYVLGIVRDGKLHLHPISETHQLRPTLTYLDVLSRKSKRLRPGEFDSDSDDGPPADPDEPAPLVPKKEKRPVGEAKEVHVTARKADDSASLIQGGISAVRREMLHIIRQEEEEKWQNLDFYDVATEQSSITLESLFSHNEEALECTTNLSTFLTSIKGPYMRLAASFPSTSMERSSDTESDSPESVTRPTKEHTFHKANPGFYTPGPLFAAVRRAIEVLSEKDAISVLEDKSHFQESSELLLQFLDHTAEPLNTDYIPEAIQIYAQLGTIFFLQRLLDFRKCIRLGERARGAQSIVVTSIDIVLAKMGSFSTSLAVGSAAYDPENEAKWIRSRREDDTVRAATQLPDSWNSIIGVIGSSNFSPAARRLATSLNFIAYIMKGKITSDKNWPREGPAPLEILQSLYLSINRAACATVSPASSADKIQMAMLVSLFADAHSRIDVGDITYTSHLRPEGFGHILEIVQIILDQHDPSLRVIERPDPAQYILLRWGNVVPWCWSTWNDQRIANTEHLRSLSATWFFFIHAPLQGPGPQKDQRIFDVDLQSTLLSDMFSSSLMVLQLLKGIIDERNGVLRRDMVTQILCKLCWASVQFLEANLLKRNPLFEELIPELCSSLMLLFPIIQQVHDAEDMLVRFLIVEALALIPLEVLSSSLKALRDHQFLTSLNESMRRCIGLLSDQDGVILDREMQGHLAKSLLNFSGLLLQSSVGDLGLQVQRSISSFIVYMSQLMEEVDHFLHITVLGPFLTVVSILRSRKLEVVKTSEEHIWLMTTQSLNQHLSVPAAFAYYLLATVANDRDPLLRHEAWVYLLGAMTKILDGQLSEEEEPLALLISPNICLALRSIIFCSGITRKYLLASPWALTMRLSLQELLDNESQKSPYFQQLQERIRSEGIELVNELLVCNTSKANQMTSFERKPRLVYHRDCFKSELIPVYDGE